MASSSGPWYRTRRAPAPPSAQGPDSFLSMGRSKGKKSGSGGVAGVAGAPSVPRSQQPSMYSMLSWDRVEHEAEKVERVEKRLPPVAPPSLPAPPSPAPSSSAPSSLLRGTSERTAPASPSSHHLHLLNRWETEAQAAFRSAYTLSHEPVHHLHPTGVECVEEEEVGVVATADGEIIIPKRVISAVEETEDAAGVLVATGSPGRVEKTVLVKGRGMKEDGGEEGKEDGEQGEGAAGGGVEVSSAPFSTHEGVVVKEVVGRKAPAKRRRGGGVDMGLGGDGGRGMEGEDGMMAAEVDALLAPSRDVKGVRRVERGGAGDGKKKSGRRVKSGKKVTKGKAPNFLARRSRKKGGKSGFVIKAKGVVERREERRRQRAAMRELEAHRKAMEEAGMKEAKELDTRALSNTGFARRNHVPPFASYGHGNTRPVYGGIMHGGYMTSHSVLPLLHKANDKAEEALQVLDFTTHAAILRKQADGGKEYIRAEKKVEEGEDEGGEGEEEEDEDGLLLLDLAKEGIMEKFGAEAAKEAEKRAKERLRLQEERKHAADKPKELTKEEEAARRRKRNRRDGGMGWRMSLGKFSKGGEKGEGEEEGDGEEEEEEEAWMEKLRPKEGAEMPDHAVSDLYFLSAREKTTFSGRMTSLLTWKGEEEVEEKEKEEEKEEKEVVIEEEEEEVEEEKGGGDSVMWSGIAGRSKEGGVTVGQWATIPSHLGATHSSDPSSSSSHAGESSPLPPPPPALTRYHRRRIPFEGEEGDVRVKEALLWGNMGGAGEEEDGKEEEEAGERRASLATASPGPLVLVEQGGKKWSSIRTWNGPLHAAGVTMKHSEGVGEVLGMFD